MIDFGMFLIVFGCCLQNIAFTQAKPLGCDCKSIGAFAPIGGFAGAPLGFGCGYPTPLPLPVAFAPFPQPVPVRIPPRCPPPSVTIPNIILALLPPNRPSARPVAPCLPPPPPNVLPLPRPFPVPVADPGFDCVCF